MSSSRAFDSPPPNLRLLRQRLSNTVGVSGELRERRIHTISNVAVAQMLPIAAVKGGTALNLRRGPDHSRFSLDVDASRPRPVDEEEFIDGIRSNLMAGWGGFTGTLTPRRAPNPKGVPAAYIMKPYVIHLSYKGASIAKVVFEPGIDEIDALNQAVEVIDYVESINLA
jgi:hypothetical protein